MPAPPTTSASTTTPARGPCWPARALPPRGTCDGKPCWLAKGSGGFKYKNKTGTPSGLTKLVLKPGEESKAKIAALAKGEQLTLPAMPLALPALVQLHRSDQPDCWEARFSAATTNDMEKFETKSD